MGRKKKLAAEVLAVLLLTGGAFAGNQAYAVDFQNTDSMKTTASGHTVATDASGNVTGIEDKAGAVLNASAANSVAGVMVMHTDAASSNSVTIDSPGYTFDAVYGAVTADTTRSNATNNTVTIKNGDFKKFTILGGGAISRSATDVSASGNTVTISGGSFSGPGGSITGGSANGKGTASDNKVIISGGTFIGDSAYGLQINGGTPGDIKGTTVANNEITISGGSFSGKVDIYASGYLGRGADAGNVINLTAKDGSQIFKGGVTLSADTLNVYGTGYKVYDVQFIRNYNFYIPGKAANGDTMLTITNGNASNFGYGNMDEVNIKAGVAGDSNLKKGDKINLIDANFEIPDKLPKSEFIKDFKVNYGTLTKGVSRDYNLTVASDGNKIVATIGDVKGSTPADPTQPTDPTQPVDPTKPVNPSHPSEPSDPAGGLKGQTKSLVETRLATMTLINQGSDMLASTGFQQAAAAAEGSRGFEPFFAVSGGKLKADTGSHVDTKGIGMNLGLAKKIDNGAGSLLIGPVVEYGRGSYDSYIDDGIHGSGDSHYWGVGLMAKQTNDNGFYYEGSIRVGKSKADYHTDDMNEHTTHVSYDTEGTYWAAHLGLGKVQEISDKNSMDYYAKYFYSHQASDNVHLSTGEDYRFDSVNSSRIRLGARYLHDFGTANRFYGGLAYQYEFSSSAKAHYDGDSTPSPDVKGSSGLIELGAVLKSSKDSPLSVDVGVNGWVGKMKGVTFGVKLGYSF